MKNLIILIVVASLAFSDSKLIDTANVMGTKIDTVCIDGYKFIITTGSTGVAIVQVYEARGGTKPARPIECN